MHETKQNKVVEWANKNMEISSNKSERKEKRFCFILRLFYLQNVTCTIKLSTLEKNNPHTGEMRREIYSTMSMSNRRLNVENERSTNIFRINSDTHNASAKFCVFSQFFIFFSCIFYYFHIARGHSTFIWYYSCWRRLVRIASELLDILLETLTHSISSATSRARQSWRYASTKETDMVAHRLVSLHISHLTRTRRNFPSLFHF